MDSFRAYLDRGHADFIAHHVTTANYTYDLPFGNGRKFALSGVADKVFGGWQLAGIMGLGSGQPYSVTFDSTLTGWPSNRADVIGDPALENRSIARWFNAAAFAVPAPFTYGNSARNLLFGPGYFNWDSAIYKHTRITEIFDLEFRAVDDAATLFATAALLAVTALAPCARPALPGRVPRPRRVFGAAV